MCAANDALVSIFAHVHKGPTSQLTTEIESHSHCSLLIAKYIVKDGALCSAFAACFVTLLTLMTLASYCDRMLLVKYRTLLLLYALATLLD